MRMILIQEVLFYKPYSIKKGNDPFLDHNLLGYMNVFLVSYHRHNKITFPEHQVTCDE